MSPPDAAHPHEAAHPGDAADAPRNKRQRTISLFNYKPAKSASRSRRVVVLLLAVIVAAVFGAWMLVGRTGGA